MLVDDFRFSMCMDYISVVVRPYLGPVVQSILSLTKSLVEDWLSFTVLSKPIVAVFLQKKCMELLHCKSSSHYFCKKKIAFFAYNTFEILTSC